MYTYVGHCVLTTWKLPFELIACKDGAGRSATELAWGVIVFSVITSCDVLPFANENLFFTLDVSEVVESGLKLELTCSTF